MNLQFFIQLRDMMSGGLVKLAQNAQRATQGMRKGNDTLAQSYDTITKKVNDLEIAIRNSTSISFIRQAKKELADLQKMQMNAPGNTSGGGGFFSRMAGSMGGLLPAMGIAGAMALGGSMLTSGLEAEARSVSFNVMAGEQKGGELNNNLTKYAQDSIYGNEVYQQAQTMLGFGLEVDSVMPNMKMLGDIAMGDANKLGSLTLAFSQVSAAGKLTGNDLLQFINAGFNPLQEISKKTGESIGVLKEKMSDGLITFDMVKGAFESATSQGGRFYDMTNKIAETNYGKLQAFQGQLAGLGMKIGGLLAPALGLVIDLLTPLVNLLSSTVGWLSENSDVLMILTTVLGVAAGAYGLFTLAMSAGAIATGVMSGAMTVLNIIMSLNPIAAVIALIAGLVAGIMVAWNKFEGFRMVVMGLWEAFKQVFSNISEFFKMTFEPIFKAIEAIKEGRWADAAKATAELIYNVSPVGMSVNAVKFAMDGGFTKGVAGAFNQGMAEEHQKTVKDNLSWLDAPEGTGLAPVASANTGNFDSLKSDADSVAKGVTGSGPRVININGVRFADKIEIHSANVREGMDELKEILDEYLLRVLNSGAALQ